MASLVDCPAVPMSKDAYDYLPKKITYDSMDSDEDDDPFDMETTCPGQRFTNEEEKEIRRKWLNRYINLCAAHAKLYNDFLSNKDDEDVNEGASEDANEDANEDVDPLLPPAPLKVLPETTTSCLKRGYCYHREYLTNETYETSQTLGFHEPEDMLQILSLRLLHTESCPISVYGMFAIRDDLEPLRNYVFNRIRDDPVVIEKDSFALPLCSPCRGMYVLDRALLEVDLWMKNEADGSTDDEQLLSVYVEINLGSCLDEKITGRIHGDHCILDMSYIFLKESVEAIIQVSALSDNPSNVRFIAFSRCFDDEIILFKGKGIMKSELIQHVVAVKAEEKLGVRLELDDSVFEWIFQDGAGVSSPSDDLIMNQFQVTVFITPKERASVTSRFLDWKSRCRRQMKNI